MSDLHAGLTRRGFTATLAGASTALGAQKYRIIDPHVHVWTHDPRYPWAKETLHPPEHEATAEMLLDLMAANGVEKTVLVQPIQYR
jgi:predicted TIM-barrel fold metal-dependent hydrolase